MRGFDTRPAVWAVRLLRWPGAAALLWRSTLLWRRAWAALIGSTLLWRRAWATLIGSTLLWRRAWATLIGSTLLWRGLRSTLIGTLTSLIRRRPLALAIRRAAARWRRRATLAVLRLRRWLRLRFGFGKPRLD